ncbi:hypothetical protein GIB67_023820 [Kingdonia uniflora]|uniref:Uncharacterized protein n=1 Tax=Kingdonia uniflora TaxID=39325 RepID=A0A7J7NGH5_9MAGN|nr:hypothetical protein GIB67_023820 [Kingdonia uniflora]
MAVKTSSDKSLVVRSEGDGELNIDNEGNDNVNEVDEGDINGNDEPMQLGHDFLGQMDVVCMHCSALHWKDEKLSNSSIINPLFGQCCLQEQGFLAERTILSVRNDDVISINDEALSLFSEESIVYLAVDKIEEDEFADRTYNDRYPTIVHDTVAVGSDTVVIGYGTVVVERCTPLFCLEVRHHNLLLLLLLLLPPLVIHSMKTTPNTRHQRRMAERDRRIGRKTMKLKVKFFGDKGLDWDMPDLVELEPEDPINGQPYAYSLTVAISRKIIKDCD